MYIYIHTHANTYIPAHLYKEACMRTCTHIRKCADIHVHVYTYTFTYIYILLHVYVHTYTCTHAHVHIRLQLGNRKHTLI